MRSDTPHRVEIGERRWPTTPVLATGLRRANGGDGHGRAAPGLPNGAGMGYRLMILYKPSPKVGKNPRILSNHSNRRSSWGLALWRAIEFLGDQLAVPGEAGVGLDDLGDFLQCFLSQLLGDLRQGLALAVT